MGTIGKRRNKEEERKKERKNERKGLTLTGLLMEGTGTCRLNNFLHFQPKQEGLESARSQAGHHRNDPLSL
jgi:hypothetical protein